MTQGFIISFEKLYACNLRLHPGIYHIPREYSQSCNEEHFLQNAVPNNARDVIKGCNP